MALGALVGCVGGAFGALVGQAALWLFGGIFFLSYRNLQWVGLPVSRAIGWAVLGIFVGAAEGVRALSPKKIAVGVLGGLLGGMVGGFALEYSRLLLPGFALFRLLGLVILGLAIGFFYGLIEQGMSFGVLRILTGSSRARSSFSRKGACGLAVHRATRSPCPPTRISRTSRRTSASRKANR